MIEPGNTRGRGGLSDEERAEFEARVKSLDRKLDRVTAERQSDATAARSGSMSGRGMAYGLRMASELVAAVIVGGLIGWGFDWLLGTKPWLFLVFFFAGFAAGVMNILRAYKSLQDEIAAETGGNIGTKVPDDDDD